MQTTASPVCRRDCTPACPRRCPCTRPAVPSRSILRSLAGRLALLALAIATAATSTHAAAVSGRVRDEQSGRYLLGSTVRLAELGRSVVSSSTGEFSFGEVPPGTYTLETSFLGYDDRVQTVTINDTPAQRLDVALASEFVELDAYVVEGTREGQLRALQQKRSADNIIDVISADAAWDPVEPTLLYGIARDERAVIVGRVDAPTAAAAATRASP